MNLKSIAIAVVLAVVAMQAIQVIQYNHDDSMRRTQFISVGNTAAPPQPPLVCQFMPFLCGSLPNPSIINN